MSGTRKGRPRQWTYPIIVLLVVTMMAAACSTGDSIPENLKSSADGLEDRIAQTREDVNSLESEYEESLETEQYRFIADYSAEERHADRFDQARTALDEADDIRENRVNDLTDGYKSEEQQDLADAINDAERQIEEAVRLAEDPAAWLDLVVATHDDPNGTVAEAEAAATAVAEDYTAIDEIVATGKQSFPEEASRFNELAAPLTELQQDVVSAIPALQQEASQSSPNYAVMTTHAETARNGQETMQGKLDELSRSETQTLIDVRVDSSVVIGRTSWDDYADYPTEHDFIYEPREVDPELATYFADLGDSPVATMNNSDELTLNVEEDAWSALEIDKKESWVDGDDESELWVDEVVDVPCHQILRLVNGEPDSSTRPDPDSNPCSGYDTPADLADGIYWEEGDGVRTEDVGMDVYSKARGLFDEQATEAASPPGMAYVGDPQAGEWREDEDGNTFWHYYGQYAFFSNLLGGGPYGSYHYRGEYDSWNRDYRYQDRGYYAGRSDDERRYGGLSPYASSRFGRSSGYGSNYQSTGLADATVRNAGPVARGGGPGGGGK